MTGVGTDSPCSRAVEDRLLLHALPAEVLDRWIHQPHHSTPRLVGVGDEPLVLPIYADGPPMYPAVWREPPRGLFDWPAGARVDDGQRYWLLTTWSMTDEFDHRLRVIHVASTLKSMLVDFPEVVRFIDVDHDCLTHDDRSHLVITAATQ